MSKNKAAHSFISNCSVLKIASKINFPIVLMICFKTNNRGELYFVLWIQKCHSSMYSINKMTCSFFCSSENPTLSIWDKDVSFWYSGTSAESRSGLHNADNRFDITWSPSSLCQKLNVCKPSLKGFLAIKMVQSVKSIHQ